MKFLITGLRAMRDAALQITREDFRAHGSEMFDDKTHKSPLKETFRILGEILIEPSERGDIERGCTSERSSRSKRC